MSIDPTKISELLVIVEKCTAHSGKLSAIANAAMSRLLEINEAVRTESIKAAKEAADMEAQQAQQAQADVQAKAEAEAKEPTPPRESETDRIAKSNMRRA
jgi:hypothetical protein